MNDQIRELVKKAGGHFATQNLMSNPPKQRESIELWDDHIEKFAELIVQECANWIVDNAGTMEHLGPEYFAQTMKNTFGVEE